jgi:O-antigen/teichoic acid export membrane protein
MSSVELGGDGALSSAIPDYSPREGAGRIELPLLQAPPAQDGAPSRGAGTEGIRLGRRAAFWGAVWTIGGFGSGQILRFAFNLILTRLLLPEVFGLMALANALITGLQLFSDVGIGPSIVQNKNGDELRFLNTAWTLQILRGLALWLCSALIAWPVATFYQTPVLLWLVPAIGATAAIAGLNSTGLHTLTRRLIRAPQVLLNVGTYVVGMVVTILWVKYVRADVWGFVVGSLVTTTLAMVASHLLVPGLRNRLCWDGQALRELLRFGKWIFVGTLCTFVADQTDRLVLGRVTSLETLGVYQIAQQLSWMPAALLCALATCVVMPWYSRQHHSPDGVERGIRSAHPLVAGFGAVLATGLLAAGPPLIACIYGERYQAAGWMVQFLAVAALFKMLEAAGSSILLATGQSRVPALNNGIKALALVLLMPAGYCCRGLPGLLGALVLADLVRYVATASALQRRRLGVLRYDVALILCVACIAVAARYVRAQPWLPAGHWAQFGVSAGVALSLWTGVLLCLWARQASKRQVEVEGVR